MGLDCACDDAANKKRRRSGVIIVAFRIRLLCITTKRTGIATRVNTIDPTRPKAMTLAMGDHMLDPEIIIGTTPTAAAIEVRKIGRNRRSPASRAALSSGARTSLSRSQ